MTATQELVVPRSIPITFGTVASYLFVYFCIEFVGTRSLAPSLLESVHFRQQFVHDLGHVTHDGDGSSILHARRANHAQQAADLAFLSVASDHEAHVAHFIPLILPTNNHLNAVGGAQLRSQHGQETILLQHFHHLAHALVALFLRPHTAVFRLFQNIDHAFAVEYVAEGVAVLLQNVRDSCADEALDGRKIVPG